MSVAVTLWLAQKCDSIGNSYHIQQRSCSYHHLPMSEDTHTPLFHFHLTHEYKWNWQPAFMLELHLEMVCCQTTYLCGWLKLNPVGKAWETAKHTPHSYPNQEARELGYLFEHQLPKVSNWALVPEGVNSLALLAFLEHWQLKCFCLFFAVLEKEPSGTVMQIMTAKSPGHFTEYWQCLPHPLRYKSGGLS